MGKIQNSLDSVMKTGLSAITAVNTSKLKDESVKEARAKAQYQANADLVNKTYLAKRTAFKELHPNEYYDFNTFTEEMKSDPNFTKRLNEYNAYNMTQSGINYTQLFTQLGDFMTERDTTSEVVPNEQEK